jgi:hypothetical protein
VFNPGFLVGSVLFIVLVFCVVFFWFVCLRPVYLVWPLSLDCPFLIDLSVLSKISKQQSLDADSGTRLGQIVYTRLRMNSSSLNEHLFIRNLVDSPNCACGQVESTSHFSKVIHFCKSFSAKYIGFETISCYRHRYVPVLTQCFST